MAQKGTKVSARNESLKLIDQLIKSGIPVSEACQKLGVSQPTYYRWRRESRVEQGNVDSSSTTAQLILNSAEALIAKQGLKVSLREISRVANVNVGTINYYFKSRNDLLYHITARGTAFFKDERFKLLNTLESKSSKITLEDIITAFYLPTLKTLVSKKRDVSNYNRFLRRMVQSTDYEIQAIVHRCYSEIHKRFLNAFSRALPGLPEKQIYWRYIAFTGVYFSITQNPIRVDMITEGKIKLQDPDKDLQELMPILIGIMRAK
tara:strand:- start:2617 stop:3405 length:789 start_codon:yes stop_codon:yes gene_type:complete